MANYIIKKQLFIALSLLMASIASQAMNTSPVAQAALVTPDQSETGKKYYQCSGCLDLSIASSKKKQHDAAAHNAANRYPCTNQGCTARYKTTEALAFHQQMHFSQQGLSAHTKKKYSTQRDRFGYRLDYTTERKNSAKEKPKKHTGQAVDPLAAVNSTNSDQNDTSQAIEATRTAAALSAQAKNKTAKKTTAGEKRKRTFSGHWEYVEISQAPQDVESAEQNFFHVCPVCNFTSHRKAALKAHKCEKLLREIVYKTKRKKASAASSSAASLASSSESNQATQQDNTGNEDQADQKLTAEAISQYFASSQIPTAADGSILFHPSTPPVSLTLEDETVDAAASCQDQQVFTEGACKSKFLESLNTDIDPDTFQPVSRFFNDSAISHNPLDAASQHQMYQNDLAAFGTNASPIDPSQKLTSELPLASTPSTASQAASANIDHMNGDNLNFCDPSMLLFNFIAASFNASAASSVPPWQGESTSISSPTDLPAFAHSDSMQLADDKSAEKIDTEMKNSHIVFCPDCREPLVTQNDIHRHFSGNHGPLVLSQAQGNSQPQTLYSATISAPSSPYSNPYSRPAEPTTPILRHLVDHLKSLHAQATANQQAQLYNEAHATVSATAPATPGTSLPQYPKPNAKPLSPLTPGAKKELEVLMRSSSN